MEDSTENIEDVIIIGAGAAGIAAFTKLLEHGLKHVKILEAENRIGGRIHSVFLGDAFVDLGAEEVHGEKNNIVVELAGEFTKKKKPLTESICYISDGTKVHEDIAERIMTLIEDFCEDDSEIEKSIGEVFTERFAERILKNCENDARKIEIAKRFLPLCESFFSILEGPYSWFDVILESASNYVDCEGDQFIGWDRHGCKAVLDVLMGRLKNNVEIDDGKKILLGKTVEKIEWKRTDKVEIICVDGSKFTAKYVIFTPSVGVLREKHADLFEPALPKNKVDVLQKIGFSNVMKIALRFKEKWWRNAPFGLIWSEDFIKDYENSWLTSVHWLMEAPENPTVLVAWLTGPATPSVEKLSNEEIKNGIMHVINMFLGKDFEVTEPEEVIPTRWHSNPNFCGTYSYETLETCNLDVPFQETLAEPLTNEGGRPVVLFAGEATHLTQYSTINGAILSGYREADRIISMQRGN